MIKQLIIDGKKSYDDFGLLIASRNISQPKKKSIKESVPYSNTIYDFSKLNGEIYWEERTLQYTFDIAEITTEEMEIVKSNAYNWLMNVHDTDIYDPYIGDYHFHGSFDSDSWSEDFGAGEIKVSFTVYPYKISNVDNSVSTDEIGISNDGTLTNSVASVVRELSIDGLSTQETRSGKNKFNINGNINTQYDGVVSSGNSIVNGNLRCTVNGEATYSLGQRIYVGVGNTITISAKLVGLGASEPTYNSALLAIINDNTTDNQLFKSLGYDNLNQVFSFQFTPTTDYIIVSFAIIGSLVTYADFSDIQVEIGTTSTPYEPYGASPSPDYPSEIESVGYENLFDKDNVTVGYVRNNNGTINPSSGAHTSDFINIKPNTNYIRTTREGNAYYDESKSFISYYYGNNILTPSNAKYIRITVIDNNLNTEQLEKGTQQHSYIPYGKYGIEVETAGKNLVDITEVKKQSNYLAGTYKYYPIYVGANKTVAVSWNASLINRKEIYVNVGYNDNTKGNSQGAWLYHPTADFYAKENTIVTTDENGYIYINQYGNFDEFCSLFTEFQVEYGNTSTEYQPYKKATSLIVLNAPLRSLPNGIKDTYENGVVTRRVGENDVTIIDSTTLPNGNKTGVCIVSDKNQKNDISTNSILSSKAKVSDTFEENTCYENPANIVFVGSSTDTLETIKTKFEGGKLLYELATPTYETVEQPSIPTYDETTYISLSNETTFEVKYDELVTKTIINNSSHRISPKIISTGRFTIKVNGTSYSVGEGTFNSGVYFEVGTNNVEIAGYGKITFSYVEEVF